MIASITLRQPGIGAALGAHTYEYLGIHPLFYREINGRLSKFLVLVRFHEMSVKEISLQLESRE